LNLKGNKLPSGERPLRVRVARLFSKNQIPLSAAKFQSHYSNCIETLIRIMFLDERLRGVLLKSLFSLIDRRSNADKQPVQTR
jgi:hypothetical protein